MYKDTIDYFANLANQKAHTLKSSPIAFLVGSMMAGAYVGLGIILIFSVAGQIPAEFQKLIMGATFGIALTLVVFAGSELFTGHTMYMVLGYLKKQTTLLDLAKIWSTSWLGNLVGSVALALIFLLGGGGELLHGGIGLLHKVATYKMNSPALELVSRAILCNWLVCLALWMAARLTSEAAKCIVIFWCLFAFIASGFEHSVANMTLLSIALLSNHPDSITIFGMMHNLIWVTLGNIIGGSLFMGVGYWVANPKMITPN
ncbi:MAG: nitrite transporter NirC [Gammaproteobacteria bacterium]|nr:nitrite transporter NirC [Gammaproteobacteria bacterium]